MITEKDNIFNWLSKTKKKKKKSNHENEMQTIMPTRKGWMNLVSLMQVWPRTTDHVFFVSYPLSLQAEKYSV